MWIGFSVDSWSLKVLVKQSDVVDAVRISWSRNNEIILSWRIVSLLTDIATHCISTFCECLFIGTCRKKRWEIKLANTICGSTFQEKYFPEYFFAVLLKELKPENWCFVSAWIGTAGQPRWPPRGQQVLHQRWIWGCHCAQVKKHASETQRRCHQNYINLPCCPK